nr:beta-glucuronidase [uncultured Ligilactobacillus sp.]
MLYPQTNACRIVNSLDGFWDFYVEKPNEKVDTTKPLTDTIKMAVPASYNDQLINSKISEHNGYFWYETQFNISMLQKEQRNVLHFGSVTHQAWIYVNGKLLGKHIGGFTPFEIELPDDVLKIGENDLKVRVSNLLDETTVPAAELSEHDGKYEVTPNFDFFNYAGIHRPVRLYTTAKQAHIESICVKYDTDLKETVVNPLVEISGTYHDISLEIFDQEGNMVESARSSSVADTKPLVISDTHLWQPLNSYLYELKICLWDEKEQLIDTYTQKFGVRTVKIKDCQIYVNDEPVYLKGFGRHEDFPVIGKGMNRAVINHDHNVMKWMHANAFRTSHYPYSEEEMQLADQDGFLVIDEVPAVGLYKNFTAALTMKTQENTWKDFDTMANHKQALKEMIERDQNHPAVIMWSVANEPASQQQGAHEYFKEIVDYTHQLDWQKLPLMAPKIAVATPDVDLTTDLFDVIALNRYYGWYIDFDDLKTAQANLHDELAVWHQKFPDKPIIFTEFGADTIAGMHSFKRTPYSEEYQTDYYQMNFKVFDELDYVAGELLWNFADFETPAGLIRVNGNRKGILTRDRQPKAIAYQLRKRWLKLTKKGKE